MLMLKCKTCGEVFPGVYVPEGSDLKVKLTAMTSNADQRCSRGHRNQYSSDDFMDWS